MELVTQEIQVKVKVLAYEKGILPTLLSQLTNDVPYATEQWVLDNLKPSSLHIDGGDIDAVALNLNKTALSEAKSPTVQQKQIKIIAL